MSRSLPARPNLRHLRNEAKKLLQNLENGDAESAARVGTHLPRLTGATPVVILAADVTLQEVQHVLAKEYGFATWVELSAAAETGWPDGDLAPLGRPLEHLTIEDVRQVCRGLSRLVKTHGESARHIPPGDFYRGLEALGRQAAPSVGEFLVLAADGAEPQTVAQLARQRGDTVARNLEVRRRLVLEGALATRRGEPAPLIRHRLDTLGHADNDAPLSAAEGSAEPLHERLARRPVSQMRHADLAMVLVDLAWIAQRRGAGALAEVVEALDEEYLRDAMCMVIDGVSAEQMSATLEPRMKADVERVRQAFAPLRCGPGSGPGRSYWRQA